MDALQCSPFDTLEICFQLLSSGPAGLALDGRRLGHGLPARRIPLVELRTLLQHPAATGELRRAVVQELVGRAIQQGDAWVVGVAGVLLPGLRRIAAAVAFLDCRTAAQVEADLLELVRDEIGHQAPGAAQLAWEVLQSTWVSPSSSPNSPLWCSDRLGR